MPSDSLREFEISLFEVLEANTRGTHAGTAAVVVSKRRRSRRPGSTVHHLPEKVDENESGTNDLADVALRPNTQRRAQ